MTFAFCSELSAQPPTVWDEVASMSGVNSELRPWVRMTRPSGTDRLETGDPTVTNGFSSWVLLLGVLPIDRHHFRFETIVDGVMFVEASQSWLNSSWRHRREVTPADGGEGSALRDQLEIEPRFQLLRPFLRLGIGMAFRHRHRWLQRHFGSV